MAMIKDSPYEEKLNFFNKAMKEIYGEEHASLEMIIPHPDLSEFRKKVLKSDCGHGE